MHYTKRFKSTQIAPTMKRTKKKIEEMIPKKEWLSISEACSFIDMSVNTFSKVVEDEGLSVSSIGGKRYFMVSEIQNILNKNKTKATA